MQNLERGLSYFGGDSLNGRCDRQLQYGVLSFDEFLVNSDIELIEIVLSDGADGRVDGPETVPVIKDGKQQQRYRAEDEIGEKRLGAHHELLSIGNCQLSTVKSLSRCRAANWQSAIGNRQ